MPVSSSQMHFLKCLISSSLLLTATISANAQSALITATGGNGQRTSVNTPFDLPLKVLVKDGSGKPAAGAKVTFLAPPDNGPSIKFARSEQTTDSTGAAQVTGIANWIPGGPYSVTASIENSSVVFNLTNTAATTGSDSRCNAVMEAVIGNVDFGPALEAVEPCTELVKVEVAMLGLKDTTTTRGSLLSPPVPTDTALVFRDYSTLDPTYFGWSKAELYTDGILRINSNLSLLADRLFSSTKLLPVRPVGGRLKNELKDARIANGADAIFRNLRVALYKLNTAMETAGLTEPFSGVFETYLIPYSSAGSNSVPSALSSLNQSTQTFAAGFLSFESTHFRSRNVAFGEISIGGRIGLSPVETLVSISSSPTQPNAYLQNAFNWNLNVRGTERLGSRMLFAGLLTFGQNILLTNSEVVTPASSGGTKSAVPATTTAPFGNHTQSGAWFVEIGPELRVYSYHVHRVADEKKFLNPSFSLSSGLRLDDRFSGLNETQYGNFWRPTQRWFLRAFVTLTNVLELNPNSSKKANSGPFNVAVGFEYDSVWGFPAVGRLVVPAVSRVYINASVDLVKAFSKQSSQ